MSAVPADVVFEDVTRDLRKTPERSLAATASFWLVLAGAVGAAAMFLPSLASTTHGWPTFAVLAVGLVVAQTVAATRPARERHQPTAVFLIAAALLLPAALVAVMPLMQIQRRVPVRMQAFAIASSTLAALASWRVATVIDSTALAAAAACVVFVGITRALAFRQPRLAHDETLATDVVLASLGVGLASIWMYDPWVTFFAIPPLLMVNRSVAVPALRAETRIDPKTGLFNARFLAARLRDELSRAVRFERPMALVMADLDHLREINNRYGHLAGDAVLTGVAKIFRQHVREYDVPARFGGEEFSILLPETRVGEALEVAERIRCAVAASEFLVSTSDEPIRATVSMGVAAFPRDGSDPTELVHQADLAVYSAKLGGRNRVVDCAEAHSDAFAGIPG